MAGTVLFALFSVLALFASPSLQQQGAKDPLRDFCRRFSHQTAVIDNKLFIDGGYINYNPLEQNPLNYTNTGLLYADLSVDNQGMPQEYANLSKPGSVPSVAGGVLWPDTVNKKLFLYGGEFQSSPQSMSLWSYDAIYDNWTAINPDFSQANIQRTSFGANAVAQEKGLGYYYGGWISNATNPLWGAQPLAVPTLLTYDFVKNTWTNSSGFDSVGRAEGLMVHIPASDGGMLIYFGGIQTPYGNSTWIGQPMDQILIYDIAGAKWYSQKATGNVPEMRRRFCGGVTWAQDQSSYNIYLYGGASMPPLTVGFDDLYILSLPSFTWIKWYPDQPGSAYPHHSLSCNVINNNQMLVMGGTFPNATTCDAPAIFGFHNSDLSKNNPDSAKWASFRYNKTGYTVPNEILAVIGGSSTGGATKRAPEAGFSSPDLVTLMSRVYKVAATRTPTRAIPTSTGASDSGSKNTGAIIGGAVAGGVVLLCLVALGVLFCMRKKKAAKQASMQQQYGQPMGASPNPSCQPPYQAPIQLPAEPYQPPAELESVSAGTARYGSPAPEKSVNYAYTTASPNPSIPSPSPNPPAGYQGYAPSGNSPAPAYNQPYGHEQQYFPTPSPPSQYTPSPDGQYPQQTYSPPPNHPYGSPTQSSPSGYTPSPVGQQGVSPHQQYRNH